MNTQNNLAIWISEPSDMNKLSSVIEQFPDVEDVCLITGGNIYHTDYATIPPFYITFYDMRVAFLSPKDYVNNKDQLRSQNIYLFCKVEDIISQNIDMRLLESVKVIEL